MRRQTMIFCLLLFCLKVSAQCRLDTDDLKNLERHASEMIEYLDDSFRKLSASKDLINKEAFIKNLLTDFTKRATIEVVNKSGKRTHKIEDYLRNVLNRRYRKRYKLVDINFVKFELDKVTPHPSEPGKYVINGSFVQIFSTASDSERDEEGLFKMSIRDRTVKNFTIYIEPITGPNGCVYIGRIDKITVKSVKFFK